MTRVRFKEVLRRADDHTMVPFLILLLVVGVVVAWKVLSKKLVGTIDAFKNEADDRGYDLDLTHRAGPTLQFDLLTAVRDTKVWTTVRRSGSDDVAHLYKFEVGVGENKQKFRRSIALIDLAFAAPKTTLRPKELQTAPPRLTDGEDHLLGREAFDDVFRVQGADEAFAQGVFDSDLGDWLLTPEGRVGDVEFELRDEQLLCAGPKADSIDELIDFLEWAQAVGQRFDTAVNRQAHR